MTEPTIIVSSDNELTIERINCCHPAHRVHRFLALFLICFLSFGSYFCYDNPSALADNIKDDLKLTTANFAMLYSIYSWPNVILCFIGGYLIDRFFGVRLGAIIYMIVLLIGALLFATGAYRNLYPLMIIGRFIFGIGGESLAVAVNSYAVLWFRGKELNMVFGLQLSFSRLGSTVNFLLMQPIYKWVAQYYVGPQRIGVVLFLSSLTILFSLCCGLILGIMDYRAEKITNRQSQQNNNNPVKLMDIRYFPNTFWLVSIICVSYYVAIFPFVALAKLFFERKFDLSAEEANIVNSLLYTLSAVLSPVFGFLIDKTGKNVYWIIISIILTVGAHSLLAFTFASPYVGIILMGTAYSLLASCLWPLVSLIIPQHQLGSAYGICQSVQNLGLAIVTIVAGIVVDKFGYLMLEMMFLSLLFISLITSIVIYLVDSSSNGLLNLSAKQRHLLQPQQQGEDEGGLIHNEEEDVSEPDNNTPNQAQAQSNRIRSKYLSQILPNSDQNERFS